MIWSYASALECHCCTYDITIKFVNQSIISKGTVYTVGTDSMDNICFICQGSSHSIMVSNTLYRDFDV